jgi:hypothetical protein
MARGKTLAAIALLIALPAAADEPPKPKHPDAFAAALADLGITEADLGYRPRDDWQRFPGFATTPYVMPFFRDLYAHPLDTYEFTRTLGNAVEDLLTPEQLQAMPTDKDRKETLFRLGVMLGTERRIAGVRLFASPPEKPVEPDRPLLDSILALLARAGETKPEAANREGLAKSVAAIPEPVQAPVSRLLTALIDARDWIDRGLRRVPQDLRDQVFASLPHLVEQMPDGEHYEPEIDDVAGLVDEHSLHYGCLLALQAVQNARRQLGALPTPKESFVFDLETPWGRISLSNRRDGFQDQWSESLMLVTWDPPSMFDAPLGATSAHHTLSVALFLPGDGPPAKPPDVDVLADRPKHTAEISSGILGCGVVYSAGTTNDRWQTGWWGLGAGLFGMGALVDEGGDDEYRMRGVGEGAALFGEGLLLDAAGNDRYVLEEGDGQGFGGPGGVGVLADRSGNDSYYAEPDAAKAGRGDYHSEGKIAVSSAQGGGFGRRGDITDGHDWAGGLGALLDVDGDDTYTAGNFSQGIGYWFGTGLLWDGGGNDRYQSVYFTQGSGAHFAIGALIDESGNDTHVLGTTAGAGLGFGWDAVNAFLIDRGDGNDVYEAKRISIGVANVRSNAFFLDEGGDDRYVIDQGASGFGDADQMPSYTVPGRTAPFPFDLGQVAIFLDLGGHDTYLRRGPDGKTSPDPDAKDGKTWHLLARDPASRAGPNVRIGRDVASGRLGFLDAWPARVPPAAPHASGRR